MTEIPIPAGLQAVAPELHKYVHSREEASTARRLLASHVTSHVGASGRLSRPLSLVETQNVQNFQHGHRGLYRDYLKAVHANNVAKSAFNAVVNNSEKPGCSPQRIEDTAFKKSFRDLVQARRKYDRLIVNQDYLDRMGREYSTSEARLASEEPNAQSFKPPAIPSVIMNQSVSNTASDGDLQTLTDHLEKAVLRAKLLLKREQKLLIKIRSDNSHSQPLQGHDRKIRALGNTRNELIAWIETELSQESFLKVDGADMAPNVVPRDIEGSLATSASLYSDYIALRQDLLTSTLEIPEISSQQAEAEAQSSDSVGIQALEPFEPLQHATSGLLSCLEKVASMTNEQKAITQQKSYMSFALSKHLKSAGQSLDRQAEESHLLPGYLPPTNVAARKLHLGPSKSFADEISGTERSDLSQRAQTWVAASEVANRALKEVVSANLEEGGVALLQAQEDLLQLLELMGNDDVIDKDSEDNNGSTIWHTLDGQLGVL